MNSRGDRLTDDVRRVCSSVFLFFFFNATGGSPANCYLGTRRRLNRGELIGHHVELGVTEASAELGGLFANMEGAKPRSGIRLTCVQVEAKPAAVRGIEMVSVRLATARGDSLRCNCASGDIQQSVCRAFWRCVDTLTKTAVVIVDDHEIVRQGLKGLIDAQPDLAVVGEAATGAGALQCVDLAPPEVLVLDLELPDISGLDVLKRVARKHPRTRVLVFSSCPAERFAAAALAAGAAAYVCKSAGVAPFLAALRDIAVNMKALSRPSY
jgi:CheY-like chemotaxis protein